MSLDLDALRKYSLSHNDLIEFTYKLAYAVRRDLSYFAEFNVTETDVAAMMTICEEFEALPADDSFRNEIGALLELKETMRASLYKQSRTITIRAKVAFGEHSSKYKALSGGNLTSLHDLDLVSSLKYQSSQAKANLTALQKEGLTQEFLTAFDAAIALFESKMFDMKTKTIDREDATETRTNKANKLYECILRFCDYGKIIFEDISPAKYNEYVIYAPPSSVLSAPANLEFRYEKTTFVWDGVKRATHYVLEGSTDGISFIEIYNGSELFASVEPLKEGWSYYRVRAGNANGYGPYSKVLKAGYYKVLPPPSIIKARLIEGTENMVEITWDEVPSSTIYKIYTSIVPIGQPANSYILMTKVTDTKYSATVEKGKRHYFSLTAESHVQWSERSASIYIDVP